MGLCRVLLVFHSMVVFIQEGRFRQLVGKMCRAFWWGWHLYALLLPFIGLSVGMAVIRAIKTRAGRSTLDRMRLLGVLGAGLADSRRYVVLGAVSLGFGTLVLLQLRQRIHGIRGGEVALADLPSVQSMLGRIGWDADKLAAFDHVTGHSRNS